MRTLAAGLALLLIAAGLLRGEAAFLAAALPLAAFAALGVFTGAPVLELEAARELSARLVQGGAPVRVTLRIVNRGARVAALRIEDVLPEGLAVVEGESTWAGSLDAGAALELAYVVSGQRGRFTLDGLRAVAEQPLAFTSSEAALSCPRTLDIHPRLPAAPDAAFGAGAARPFSGRSRARRIGSGTDFAGTRDYAAGDPLRHLNWRAEALWGRPIVNIFEEERAIDAGIILDCRAEAYDRPELFEAAVAAALALAEDLLDRGDRVAFLSYGSLIAWTPSGSGREQRLRLRLAAARAELGAHAAFDRFDNLPVRIFPPRSLVLLVSPLGREDVAPLRSLKALGYEVAVLRPDPMPRGAEAALPGRWFALEGEVLLARLLRAGIGVLDWHPETPLAALRLVRGGRP